ncbi:MAG: hypothetical protein WAP52_04190 [Candidatus Sungiibacteriota bacterium]
MAYTRISVSMRRFVRREKARIRRDTADRTEREKRISDLIIATRKTRKL